MFTPVRLLACLRAVLPPIASCTDRLMQAFTVIIGTHRIQLESFTLHWASVAYAEKTTLPRVQAGVSSLFSKRKSF